MAEEAIHDPNTGEGTSPGGKGHGDGMGIVLEPYQIILRPLVTEKGMHRSTRYNAYAFEVHRQATKDAIRHAVQELFNVKVLRVHTQNRKGKPRRSRFSSGYTKDWKKAIVKLDPEHRIDFF